MLTIAKMGAHSVAYYQSTVDENRGRIRTIPRTESNRLRCGFGVKTLRGFGILGTDNGAIVSGKRLRIGSIRRLLRAVRDLEMLRERTVFQASI